MAARTSELSHRQISLQGVDFVWHADAFDNQFGVPTQVSKSSSLGWRRGEITAYDNNLAKWAIGRVALVKTDFGEVMLENRYNQTTGDLDSVWRFSTLDKSFLYNPDGTVKSSTDGLNHTTTFSDYKRGIPRRISYPDGGWQRVGAEVRFLDALWRPVYTIRWDGADPANTERFVKRRYDHAGRLTFESYPTRTARTSTSTPMEGKSRWRRVDLGLGGACSESWRRSSEPRRLLTLFMQRKAIPAAQAREIRAILIKLALTAGRAIPNQVLLARTLIRTKALSRNPL